MSFLDTIEKPWRDPIGYLELAFAIVIFLIVIGAMTDMLRALPSFIEG